MMTKQALLIGLLPCVLAPWSSTKAQVKAHSAADEIRPRIQRFEPPMVLEVPVPGLSSLKNKEILRIDDLGDYVCRGVSIRSLALQPTARKEAWVVDMKALFAVEEGIDMRTDLMIELMDGEKVVSTQRIDNLSTEEGKTRTGHAQLQMQQQVFQGLQHGSPGLRLTLTTREDP